MKRCERCGVMFRALPWNAGRYCIRTCMIQTPRQRFDSKVEKRPDGCWMWTGNTHINTGYGTFGVVAGRTESAHRYAYELAHGAIPAGMHVCHHCDVKACVNPAHLFLGTPADNQADKVAKNRQLRGEQNGAAILTSQDVIAIRAASGLQREIAAQFGISRSQVSMVKSRRVWAHL